MENKIHKSKIEKYGSFLYCQERQCLCFGCYTEDGNCKHESCILDSPEHEELMERIRRNREKNKVLQKLENREEKNTKIRAQRKSKIEILKNEIAKKEAYARACYKNNNPRKGDEASGEAMMLQAQLNRYIKRMRGNKA